MNATEAISKVKAGYRVTIETPQGNRLTGKAVICSGTHVALNMGGKYGTPGVATPENVVSIPKLRWSRK